MISWYTRGVLAIAAMCWAAGFVIFQSPDSAAQEVPSATGTQKVECPPDMVEIEGRFCIDRFEYPNEEGAVPLGGVTWLQALAKCKAKGKRLCTSAEWQRTCSGPSGTIYPYGNEYDRRQCRSGRKQDAGAAPSGNHPNCRSEEGVYDLSGNLWEWTGTQPAEAALAGGDWMSDGSHSRCDSRTWIGVPQSGSYAFGFRCCASLKNPESRQ